MPACAAIRGPCGPGSVSIGTQPSSRSGASSPSRERTKARSGAATMPSMPPPESAYRSACRTSPTPRPRSLKVTPRLPTAQRVRGA